MSKKCLHCNIEINKDSFKCSWTYKRAKFCNSNCYQLYHSAKNIENKCEYCNKIYITRGSIGSKRFCSRDCRYKKSRTVGTKYIDKAGYIRVKTENGYVFEHRLVMSNYLKRELKPNEQVHHKDGNKTNNSIDNLELFNSNSEHIAFHAKIFKDKKEPLPFNRPESIKKRMESARLKNWVERKGCDY